MAAVRTRTIRARERGVVARVIMLEKKMRRKGGMEYFLGAAKNLLNQRAEKNQILKAVNEVGH